MSKEEHSVQSKKIYISSNDSLNKKDEGPIRTSQSMNTESYEYFSQRITTKNNITESSYQGSNQKIKNQEFKCSKKFTRIKMYLWSRPSSKLHLW